MIANSAAPEFIDDLIEGFCQMLNQLSDTARTSPN